MSRCRRSASSTISSTRSDISPTRCASRGSARGECLRQVVLQRLGREEVLDETLREHLERWYADALERRAASSRSSRPTSTGRRCPTRASRSASRRPCALRPKGALPDPLVLEAPRHDGRACRPSASSASSSSCARSASPLVARRAIARRSAATSSSSTSAVTPPTAATLPGARRRGLPRRARRGRILPQMEEGVVGMRAGEQEDDRGRRSRDDYPSPKPRRPHRDVRA